MYYKWKVCPILIGRFVLQSFLNLFFGFVFQVIEEEKIQENSHVTGTYMLEELAKIRDEVEIVGDVRGKGLMIGVEMVTDKVGFCLDMFVLNIVILHPFFDYLLQMGAILQLYEK